MDDLVAAAHTGASVFNMQMIVSLPSNLHIARIRDEFAEFCDELNIDAVLEFIYKFTYQAQYDDSGAENELCHVFLGRVGDDVRPNDHEIAALRYVAPGALLAELEDDNGQFTPWFKMEWLTLLEEHRASLAQYCEV